MVELPSKVKFAVILTVGIIVTGILDYALSMSGLSQIGMIVWIIGYGATIFSIWYIWVRPIDFDITGPRTRRDQQMSSTGSQPVGSNEDSEE